MRIVVTGSKGQLGRALLRQLQAEELLGLDIPEHDITDLMALDATMQRFRPHVVIHCAAMTDVDGCERDPDAAYRLNVLGSRNVAVCAERAGAAIVAISTDYVFDGSQSEPYRETDEAHPLSVYGRTKWLGEEMVRHLCPRHYIVRVAWLYDAGPRNFVATVLRLADQRDVAQMVTDEIGSPTYAHDVAVALDQLIRLPAYGTYHLPNAGACSRYEWAAEILHLAGRSDDLRLEPSENYARLARVPKRVEMRNMNGAEIGITMRSWQEALAARFRDVGDA
jgi:dTDP-4-dehydrorhamnose reductase